MEHEKTEAKSKLKDFMPEFSFSITSEGDHYKIKVGIAEKASYPEDRILMVQLIKKDELDKMTAIQGFEKAMQFVNPILKRLNFIIE